MVSKLWAGFVTISYALSKWKNFFAICDDRW